MRELMVRDAIREALDEEMARDNTVFGEVTEGMEVVDNIEIAKTNRADRPIENIRILKASIQ